MKAKSYRDLLTQIERIYQSSDNELRAGREYDSMRFVWARKAFDRYSYNIAKALGKRLDPSAPIYMARRCIGTEYEFSKKFPASVYAK